MKESIAAIEASRDSKVLVLFAPVLTLELLPPLHEALQDLRPVSRLDVVLHSRGGTPNAARRIALLLREMSSHVCIIVPHHCESSATIVTLAADEIIAGPLAIFTPVDPLLESQASGAEGNPSAVAAEDVRLYPAMCRDWFGLEDESARRAAFAAMTSAMFPTTLTTAYRSMLEVEHICLELIGSRSLTDLLVDPQAIVEALLHGFHSHGFALTREDLAKIGLPILRDERIEQLGWQIDRALCEYVGSNGRREANKRFCDVALISHIFDRYRYRDSSSITGSWQSKRS